MLFVIHSHLPRQAPGLAMVPSTILEVCTLVPHATLPISKNWISNSFTMIETELRVIESKRIIQRGFSKSTSLA